MRRRNFNLGSKEMVLTGEKGSGTGVISPSSYVKKTDFKTNARTFSTLDFT